MSKVDIIKRPVEQVGSEIKKNAWSAAIESLALLVLGVLFIIWPEEVNKFIAYFVGAFLIVRGGVQIVTYYMEKGQNDFFNNGLLSGVISVILGIAAIVIGENIQSVLRVVIGVIIVYESLVRINTAVKLSSAGVKDWRPILVIALIMLVIGGFVTFNTGAITMLMGWMMIVTGVIGIVGDVMFIRHVNTVIEKLTGAINAKKTEEKYENAEEAEVKD